MGRCRDMIGWWHNNGCLIHFWTILNPFGQSNLEDGILRLFSGRPKNGIYGIYQNGTQTLLANTVHLGGWVKRLTSISCHTATLYTCPRSIWCFFCSSCTVLQAAAITNKVPRGPHLEAVSTLNQNQTPLAECSVYCSFWDHGQCRMASTFYISPTRFIRMTAMEWLILPSLTARI